MQCCSDTVFYRIFCVSLLFVAFIFTVILTNVFIDIDSLIWTKRNVENSDTNDISSYLPNNKIHLDNDMINNDYVEDLDESYRSKRSLESHKILLHIKNPMMKNLLANRLVDLLEELDAEEPKNIKIQQTQEKIKDVPKSSEIHNPVKGENEKKNSEMLHLAMHNILLQGILGHMDLNHVYKQVHTLVNKFEEKTKVEDTSQMNDADVIKITKRKNDQESKITEDLIKCNKIQKLITESTSQQQPVNAGPQILIKTTIDIITSGNGKDKNNCTDEDVKGYVNLNYNGNSVKLSDENENFLNMKKKQIEEIKTKKTTEKEKDLSNRDIKVNMSMKNEQITSNSYLDNIVAAYLTKYKNSDTSSVEVVEKFENKRSKRHVRVRYDTDKDQINHSQKEDDELYVEIETHFNNKGLKGELKKKIMKNIIEKIKKVIHNETNKNKKRTHKTSKVANHTITFNKDQFNIFRVPRRHSEPIISKSKPMMEPLPLVAEKTGEKWKQMYSGPGYLSASKAINSAEAGTVDIEYDKITKAAVPQRVQEPINNQISNESHENFSEKVFNVGNIKFYVKNIEGSGLSIGFSQFTEEPPEMDSLKSIFGVESLTKNYRQMEDASGPSLEDDLSDKIEEIYNDHIIKRRSIQNKSDYHSNEYKVIFENHNFLPYLKTKNIAYGSITQPKLNESNEIIIDDNILSQNLNPSEIFGLANMIDRKKRTAHLKREKAPSIKKYKYILNKIRNMFKIKGKSKNKLSLTKNKRQKRDIEKIRIIATDILSDLTKSSDEYAYDSEVYGNRATLREVQIPEIDRQSRIDDPYEYNYHFNVEEVPLAYNIRRRSPHNGLMSKYPHIIMEDDINSKESDIMYGNPTFVTKLIKPVASEPDLISNMTVDAPAPKVQELLNAISPDNFKLSIKILPKNLTGDNTGFKEIHTSINKSYNNNGLTFISLLNVSEITKVEKSNNSVENITNPTPIVNDIKKQQHIMRKMLKDHKESLDKKKDLTKNFESKFNIPIMDTKDFIDIIHPLDPSQKLHFKKDDITRLISTAFVKQNKDYSTTESQNTVASSTTVPTTLNDFSSQIMSTINNNVNFTNEILNKIDKNTQILKMFLHKITNKIKFGNSRANIEIESEKPKENVFPIRNFYEKDWHPNNEYLVKLDKNSSNPNIPFIYTYHQPYIERSNLQTLPIVYHGQIHANPIIPDKEIKNELAKVEANDKEKRNNTRFFVEDLDFKIKPLMKKSIITNKNNTTAVL